MVNRVRKLSLLSGLLCVLTAAPSRAGIPFPPLNTCRVTVTQYPCRPKCLADFTPEVIRLCPSSTAPVFDSVRFDLTIVDALAFPVSGVFLSVYELSGTVNIATGGSTTDVTDSLGHGSVIVDRGSGCGQVGVCADGVLICEVNVRSPDIALTSVPTGCTLPVTGTSFVNSSDKMNPSCGFNVHFGPVIPGSNDCWDLNCDNFVNSVDTNGGLAPPCPFGSGWVQHFGHGAALGTKNTCP